MFARKGSPFPATNSMYAAFATAVEEYASTLAKLQCRVFESSEIRAPELIGFVCKVEHPSEAVDVSAFRVHFCSSLFNLHEKCVPQLLTGTASIMTIVPFPFKARHTEPFFSISYPDIPVIFEG